MAGNEKCWLANPWRKAVSCYRSDEGPCLASQSCWQQCLSLCLMKESEKSPLSFYYTQRSVTYAGKTDKTCQRPGVSLVSIVATDDKQTVEVIWSQDKQAMIEEHGLEFSASCLFVIAPFFFFVFFFSYTSKNITFWWKCILFATDKVIYFPVYLIGCALIIYLNRTKARHKS